MEILELEQQELRDYKDDVLYETRQTHLEESYETGTLKITNELSKKAITAFKSRMDAVKSFHDGKKDQIDKNYAHYNQRKYVDNAQTQLPLGETYLAVEEIVDDLVFTFTDLADHLKLKDDMQLVDDFMVKKLEVKSGEYQKPFSLFKAFTNLLFNDEAKKTETYYFKRKELIKNMIKWGLDKSGFKKNAERYFFNGIISGTFLYKETFADIEDMKLVMHKKTKDKEYRTVGNITQEIVKESVYKFEVPDLRNIYTNRTCDWVAEKIETDIYSILSKTFDADGKPLDYPLYDPNQVRKLVKYLKENDLSVKTRNSNIRDDGSDTTSSTTGDDDEDDTNSIDDSEIWSIDGNIDIYEAHYIPMLLEVKDKKGKKVKRVVNSMMTFVDIGGEQYLPIQIQPSPYYRLPYNFTQFIMNEKDCYGLGLSQITEKYQDMINELFSFTMDITRGSVWGTTFFDDDYISEPELLENKSPRRMIAVKNLKGEDIRTKVVNYLPPVEVLGSVTNIIDRLSEIFRRMSRKGPIGEKMQPNPSATEFESINKELTKTINRTVLRVEQAVLDMIKGMYVYTVNYREEPVAMEAEAIRTTGDKDDLMQGLEKGKFLTMDKSLVLDPKELFVDNLGFDLLVVKDKEKESVEKQQTMQLIQLLYQIGAVIDPATGTPKTYQDESGTTQVIDEYNMLSGLFIKFGVSPNDVWKKQIQQQPIQELPQELSQGNSDGVQQVNPPNPPSTPNLQATPTAGNILGTSQRVV